MNLLQKLKAVSTLLNFIASSYFLESMHLSSEKFKLISFL